jgi:hypothetical protein
MMKKKPRIGDICELKTSAGLAYLQYTHDGKDMGQLVRVLPGWYSSRPPDFSALTNQQEMYFTFYTLEYALRAKQVEIVSNQPVPEWARDVPVMRKAGGLTDTEGRTLNWTIGPALKLSTIEDLKRAHHIRGLTPEQAKLSIDAIWPHPIMVQKIAEGWTPERDEEINLTSRRETERVTSVPKAGATVEHYLYFRRKNLAKKAAMRLEAKGWQAEVRLGADGENWLTLARQPAPLEENFEGIRDELVQLAEVLHGEYDGWQVTVGTENKPVG